MAHECVFVYLKQRTCIVSTTQKEQDVSTSYGVVVSIASSQHESPGFESTGRLAFICGVESSSPLVCVSFLQVLRLSPTIQRQAC